MGLTIDIAVEAEAWSGLGDLEALVRRCGDEGVKGLNHQFRDKDAPTNVLSFPAGAQAPGGPRLLGDIAVAFETASREAGEEGKPLEAHVAHLLVHGVLHLLDHDHDTDEAAGAMEALETRILAGLGIADPYAGSDPLVETTRL